ncbi:MAG: serine--tRNA ligase, partial [archaeon]|nr:serine--tRNA ligase [archaeon]
MLNINLIREDPAAVKKNLEKRRNPEYIKWLDDLVKKDAAWRALKQESDKIRARRNEITREIKEAKNRGKDTK